MNFVSGGLLVVSVLLTGCGSLLVNSSSAPVNGQDPALLMLQKSAQSIQQSLTRLSEAEQYEKMGINPTKPTVSPKIVGMEQVVVMPWHGAMEQAVTRLTSYANFSLRFLGRPPVLPIIVQLGAAPTSISDLIQNIGIQAGHRADIVVDPGLRVVEVRYSESAL
jgi:defect-in-organelle-trafficking protein DotD